MENYFYKCKLCGFVHLVPAYWVSFEPDGEMEFIHINPETKEICENQVLLLEN